jgi:hypothetical protein
VADLNAGKILNCPKCQYQLPDQRQTCPQCGIVFDKYFKYHPGQATGPDSALFSSPRIDTREDTSLLKQLLLNDETSTAWTYFLGRAIIFSGLIIWGWLFISASIESNVAGNSFLHGVNLSFHEAGHIIFRPFGAFITSLGGTLGQLLMPSICLGVLLIKTRDPFGAAVALWWIGENFLDIAPYINDARAGQLPLLGGNFGHSAPYGFHDWEYLLTESGLLSYDHALAKTAFLTGSAIMLLAVLWSGFLLVNQYRRLANRGARSESEK